MTPEDPHARVAALERELEQVRKQRDLYFEDYGMCLNALYEPGFDPAQAEAHAPAFRRWIEVVRIYDLEPDKGRTYARVLRETLDEWRAEDAARYDTEYAE